VGRACDTHGRGEESVRGFGGKGKRPLERTRRRWKDGIRMDLREIRWGRVWSEYIYSGYGQLAGFGECGDEPPVSGATDLVNTILLYII
jgi:hypothetical protein